MEKINVAEILKDCPSGMELDCTMYENVYFDKIYDEDCLYQIGCYTINDGVRNSINFTKYGKFNTTRIAKCVIFPKGKTTWEGFQRPFKDGDIVVNQNNVGTWIGIYHRHNCLNQTFSSYCYIRRDGKFYAKSDNGHVYYETRFATEEEKQKLFDAIKSNGYKWNTETKTLEKLVEPKFKVGDRITKRGSIENSWIISSVSSEYYGLQLPKGSEGIGVLPVCDQDDYELISDIEPKFKKGDRIKHKVNTEWVCTIRRVEDRYYVDGHPTCYTILFDKQGEWELVSDKFDINTLTPFESRVLVRDYNNREWDAAIFARYTNRTFNDYNFVILGGRRWKQCIPYEGNEHLFGTTNDCEDYFKNWSE